MKSAEFSLGAEPAGTVTEGNFQYISVSLAVRENRTASIAGTSICLCEGRRGEAFPDFAFACGVNIRGFSQIKRGCAEVLSRRAKLSETDACPFG